MHILEKDEADKKFVICKKVDYVLCQKSQQCIQKKKEF